MKKKTVCIINYGVGNIQSILNISQQIDCNFFLSDNHDDILNADYLILPGVGNFSSAMRILRKKQLIDTIIQRYHNNKPILGICLGMHLFFESSDEGENIKGLSLIKGNISKIESNIQYNRYVPHIGWHKKSKFYLTNKKKNIKEEFENVRYYFLHSYYLTSFESEICKLFVEYKGIKIPAIVQKGSISGIQFHPEVSGLDGINFYKKYFTLYS
jgi:imidazole glycerol-phosphate synthase subunit HisH